jgi:hypothetical protein
VKVDWDLKKSVADDVAHTLSSHFNVIAGETPRSQSAAEPNPPVPTLQSLRNLGIEPSAEVDTYIVVYPTSLGADGPGLLVRNSYAFTGLVMIGGGGEPALLASYAVTVIDARTGESIALGMPQIHKRALGMMGAFVPCDRALWPDTPTAISDTQRQMLTREFTTLLKASLPWALANAGLLSATDATADEAAAGDFSACHRAAF